jgi:hypothetical protein
MHLLAFPYLSLSTRNYSRVTVCIFIKFDTGNFTVIYQYILVLVEV